MYKKGARAERELIKIFSDAGYAIIRAAGSGVNSESPDILVFKKGKQYAFECKAWNKDQVSIEAEKMNGLKRWQEVTGITTMVGWKMPYEGWYFIYPSEFSISNKYCSICKTKAKMIARKIEDLI